MNPYPNHPPAFKSGDLYTTNEWLEEAEGSEFFFVEVYTAALDPDDPTQWIYFDDACEYWTKEVNMIPVEK